MSACRDEDPEKSKFEKVKERTTESKETSPDDGVSGEVHDDKYGISS